MRYTVIAADGRLRHRDDRCGSASVRPGWPAAPARPPVTGHPSHAPVPARKTGCPQRFRRSAPLSEFKYRGLESPQRPPTPRAMGTAAGVAVTVRRPVWCGQRRSGGSPADGRGKRTPPSCAHCADRDRSTKSRCDRVGRLSHPTGQAVIVALRRVQRPVWAPGVRILGNLPISRTDRADSPIAQIRANDRDRGLGPLGLAETREKDSRPTGVTRRTATTMPSGE